MKDKLKGKEQEVLAIWDNGISIKELALQYDVAPSSLRVFLNKHDRNTTRKIRSEMPTLDIKDAAYIAGIIDGEGCISARMMKSRNSLTAQSVITVGTSSKELAEYLQRVTGTGYRGHFSREQKQTWRPLYVWGVSSWQGIALLKQILPYLVVKREQAELYIELGELKRRSSPHHKFNEKRQLEIIERFRMLNHRGIDDT